ncbi:hypothetical protein D9M68_982400 [compost metagenome]
MGEQVTGSDGLPALEVGLVLLLQSGGHGLVVAREYRVGLVRDTVLQHLGVQHAQQCVTDLQVVVHEGQGTVG